MSSDASPHFDVSPNLDASPTSDDSEDFDEFSFLPVLAEQRGTPVPVVRRVSLPLESTDQSETGTLSGLRWGTGSPRFVFLHGAGLNAHTWDATLTALGEPALALDLPGHGDSSWRDDADYRARTLAPAVAEALRAWTDAPVVLVGQSLGGLTAAAVAAAHPELVSAVVVIDITPGITAEGPGQLREFFSGPLDYAGFDDLVDRALAFGLGGSRAQAERGVRLNARRRPDGRVEWKHHFARLANPDAPPLPAPIPAHSPADGWTDLAAIEAPLTLIRASDGYVSLDALAEFEQRVPTATMIPVSAGHNVQEYIPDDLAAHLRAIAPDA